MAPPAPQLADKAASSVYINDALTTRTIGNTDLAAEKRAVYDLAAAMVDRPAEVLPKFVELAMALTGGVSAGLSLYEAEPAPGVFRWRHLVGMLAPFEGALTPRNDSPCGVTLDRNCPTLSSHPESIYDWISVHDLIIPEVLLVPLYIGTDEPLGTLWIVAGGEGHFNRAHADTANELAGFAGMALKMIREREQLQASLDEQELLAQEMNHRLKNLFAMTDGMIRGSARSADSVADFADALSGRLHALADAHALVQRQASGIGGDNVTDLASLIGAVVKVHDLASNGNPRIAVDGPSIPCGEHATNAVALTIHELATNAAKYGALSRAGGAVEVRWFVEDGWLVLDWHEKGGPTIVDAPSREGFGTTLIQKTIERQFGGRVVYDWLPEGLCVTARMDLEKLAR